MFAAAYDEAATKAARTNAYETLIREMEVSSDFMSMERYYTIQSWISCLKKFWTDGAKDVSHIREIYYTLNVTIPFMGRRVRSRMARWASLLWEVICFTEIIEEEQEIEARMAEAEAKTYLDLSGAPERPQLTEDKSLTPTDEEVDYGICIG